MREMTLYGVSFEPIGKQPIVLLKTADDDRFLPIWIGHPEAAAILMKLQGANPPRPMTHDLFSDVISELQDGIGGPLSRPVRASFWIGGLPAGCSLSGRWNGLEVEATLTGPPAAAHEALRVLAGR